MNVLFFFSANLSYSTRPLPILTSIFTTVPCISYLSTFQTRLVLHMHLTVSDCSANHNYNITISFHHFQNVIVGE